MAGKGNRLKQAPMEPENPAENLQAPFAEEEKSTRKAKPKKAKAPKPVNFPVLTMLRDERSRKIAGLFLMLMSVVLVTAFTSYFFTWRADHSLVSGSWFDLFRYSDKQVENWLGKFGAVIAHQFIHTWFGLAAYGIAFIGFLSGFRVLFQTDLLPFGTCLRHTLFA
ncbi:MAG: DNA translocase FtsK 4TM domain-containing protein, partial [Bacteroidota bacterium]